MGKLIILLPFTYHDDSDLFRDARALQQTFASIQNNYLGSNIEGAVTEIILVFLEDEYVCEQEDYVIVFAHGAAGRNTALYNNQGGRTTMNNAIRKLRKMDAQNARKVLFMACYSAYDGHIAQAWKSVFPNQAVYGGTTIISNFFKATRRSITGVCTALQLLPQP